ncbi:N-6 DNA methylase [Undibacterium umbellatum]|uniref:site-specific DNA-methyltransferase (adenine-specific) n=1 Tax=Undibacterium umbellatum TaxID=2762300 RepID=A0ABR6ZEM2_9BURK|nr:N-6 DNA methylase [Undibacterium umbellatum]MBC3910182.1 N-6 DNA methylase [Undibacterium umbellatum]
MSLDEQIEASELTKKIWRILDRAKGSASIDHFRKLAFTILIISFFQAKFDKKLKNTGFLTIDELRQHIADLMKAFSLEQLIATRSDQNVIFFLKEEIPKTIFSKELENDVHREILAFLSDIRSPVNETIAQKTLYELNARFTESESRTGSQFYTPNDLNKLVLGLGKRNNPQSIYDPFAGGGLTAFQFYREIENAQIYTQEINSNSYYLEIIARIILDVPGHDVLGNFLSKPCYGSDSFDLVVSFPPISLRVPKYIIESAAIGPIKWKDENWIPLVENLPETKSDLFIVLSMLNVLNPKGTLITCCQLGPLTRSGKEFEIRKQLIRNNLVDAVILLPSKIHFSTKVQTVLLILKKSRSISNKNQTIRFVDASSFCSPRKGRHGFDEKHIEYILDATENDGKYSVSLDGEFIIENGASLDPSNYVKKSLTLRTINLRNFRGYRDFSTSIHKNLTVLVGENGAGKTSILEAIAASLGPFLTSIPEAKGRLLRKSDIRISAEGESDYAQVFIETNSSLSWDLSIRGATKNSIQGIGHSALAEFATEIVENNADLPLVAYYGTNRTLTSAGKVAIDPFEKNSRYEGYDGALEARLNYASIKNWFSKIEVAELRIRDEEKQQNYIHPVKSLILRAIQQIVPSATNISFDRNESDIRVQWRTVSGENVSLSLEQLSEGNRSMVSMTVDLVRRAYQLNPESSNPLNVVGIVLIDEIELHLHPRWQQKVLDDLRSLFPNIQFVVSTHSPQVLTTVKGENIRTVSYDSQVSGTVSTPYGAESGWVMEEILGVKQRPETEVIMKLRDYFNLIEDGLSDSETARRLRREIEELTDGKEPLLLKADLAIKRVNWVRSKKGE